jgi:hypothetical protein
VGKAKNKQRPVGILKKSLEIQKGQIGFAWIKYVYLSYYGLLLVVDNIESISSKNSDFWNIS